ncbi:class I SAM-dependent methyltransferase [bacterium]|nr:MAG: class I SAM-dependent methyltransferase [bacterium]
MISRAKYTGVCDGCGIELSVVSRSIGVVVGRCRSCASLFMMEGVEEAVTYEQCWGELFDQRLATIRAAQARQIVRRLEAATVGRKVLDIGAGRGILVGALRAHGWDALGIDSDAQSVRLAGGMVRHASVESIESGTFDVVTMMDVLEHVRDRIAALNAVNARLVAGGLLVLRVPNCGEITMQCKRAVDQVIDSAYLCPMFGEHKVYYSALGLARAAERSGFHVINCWYEHEPVIATAVPGWRGIVSRVGIWALRRLAVAVPRLRVEIALMCTKV